MTTPTFSVKNFERFQHYKDRCPPWIKLYNELLDDYEFGRLPDASKMHLIAIWLLASRSENKLPYDSEWIARRINATEPVDLDLLRSLGFIVADQPLRNAEQLASKSLAKCLPRDRGETEGEERQRERHTSPGGDGVTEAFDAYNERAKELGLPTANQITSERRRKLKARLAEHGISGWLRALDRLREQPFCLGEGPRGWRADLDFLLQPKSFQKVLEGGYANAPPKSLKQQSMEAACNKIIAEADSESNIIDLPATRLKIGGGAYREDRSGELHAASARPGNHVPLLDKHAGGSAPCDVEPDG